jgi:hypothetical protein
VDIHRNWKASARGPAYLALAVVMLFAPQILAAIGYEFMFGNWIPYVLAAISLVAGIVYVAIRFRAYAVRIDENGVTWTEGTRTVSFGWSDVVRASLERKPNAPKRAKPSLLTVWTRGAVQYPVGPTVKLDGLNGYRVAEMAEIREPVAAVTTALRTYGGDRFPEGTS